MKIAKSICESKPSKVFPAAAGALFQQKLRSWDLLHKLGEVFPAAAGALFPAECVFLGFRDMH